MLHTSEQILQKARLLAKKVLELKHCEKIPDCYEISDIIMEAMYIETETRYLDSNNTDSQ